MWLDNNMHGKGNYLWNDGRYYDGEYKYDLKNVFLLNYTIYSSLFYLII
jgi:hypothetical protein